MKVLDRLRPVTWDRHKVRVWLTIAQLVVIAIVPAGTVMFLALIDNVAIAFLPVAMGASVFMIAWLLAREVL